jgi:hypothetical protein
MQPGLPADEVHCAHEISSIWVRDFMPVARNCRFLVFQPWHDDTARIVRNFCRPCEAMGMPVLDPFRTWATRAHCGAGFASLLRSNSR